MGLFNRKKLVALMGVGTPQAEPKRDITGKFLSGDHEQQQEQRLLAIETALKAVNTKLGKVQAELQTGGCKCGTKEPEVKSVTKAKPKK